MSSGRTAPRERPAAPAGALTLPARFYCDAGIFDREKERVHRAMWNAVAATGDLPSGPGGYRVVEVAGDSLIVVRGRDGQVRALANVCRHRGTRLLDAGAGCLPGAVRCPYHAWTYGLDGRLRSAPHMDQVPGFRLADWPLAEAAAAEWGGLLWVRAAPAGPSLDEQLGPAAERVRPYGIEHLVAAHTEHYQLAANWKLIVQNFSECLHCPVIHPQLQRLSHYLTGDNFPLTPGAVGSTMDLAEGVETLSEDGKLVGAPLPGLGGHALRRVGYEILLPNLMLCLHPDYVVRYFLEAVAVDRTQIRCEWLFSREAVERPGFDPRRSVSFWDTTNRQDWRVSELAQAGISSGAYRPGPYSNREDQLWALDGWIRERLDEDEL